MVGLKSKIVLMSIVFSCLFTFNSVSFSAGWYDLPYDHFSKDEELTTLLSDFSSTIGIPIIVSDRLQSSGDKLVNGHFKNVTAELFLLKLSNLYQIVWYYDGHMLFIYHADELKTELLNFSDAKANGVRNTLKRLGVWDPRFNWREMREKNLLFISGPPRYIELVKEVSMVIENNLKKQKDTTYEVKVFPLSYAWADDRSVTHRGKTVKIQGVASTIKSILGGGRSIRDSSSENSSSLRGGLNGLTAKKGLKGKGILDSSSNEEGQAKSNASGFLHDKGENAYIEANSQQNAVIVYDLASRMTMYADLIKSLDVKAEQIEIEVSIIDINTEHLFKMGVDWRNFNSSGGSFGFGDANDIATDSGQGLSHTFGLNSGESLTSVLNGGADFFLGRIRLLSEDGEGQILSQPSVMTMNNIEAIIDHSTTFYVKLEGQEEVDLVPISTGAVLKVTPRVINEEDDNTKIHLNVEIEDGRLSNENQDGISSVEGIPSITVSQINTQAVIGQDSSLLVGGYYYDQTDSVESGVPVLGKIPGIKWLFSSQQKTRNKLARLFLITPKILIEQDAIAKGNRIRETIEEDRSFDELKYEKPKYEVLKYSSPQGLNIYD